MSVVKLGIAGCDNTTVTMFNNEEEDFNIKASMDSGNITNKAKAELSVATKRLKSDGEYTKHKDPAKRGMFTSNTDGAILFPV